MTIKEAIAELEPLASDSYCIELVVWQHKGDRASDLRWSVWLAEFKEFYHGSTLMAAVSAAVEALTPEGQQTAAGVEDLEAQIGDIERQVAK